MPDNSDLTGVARGAETVLDVLGSLTRDGFIGQFMAVEPEGDPQVGRVECLSCHTTSSAGAFEVSEIHRLEGASDPDDMLAIVASMCPNCETRGALTLNYGPTATVEDSAALLGLDEPDHAP